MTKAREKWSAEDDQRLMAMYQLGLRAKTIAVELDRTPEAIKARVAKLKLTRTAGAIPPRSPSIRPPRVTARQEKVTVCREHSEEKWMRAMRGKRFEDIKLKEAG